MLLTYSKPQFQPLIESGVKIHTIREDSNNRWKPGRTIQHWMHNPRNVSKNPYPFAKNRDDLNTVISIEYISIVGGIVHITAHPYYLTSELKKQKGAVSPDVLDVLARNDGFENWRQMRVWFRDDIELWKIIHWTDYKYCV